MEYDLRWQGHRDLITEMSIMEMREGCLLTGSMDGGVKIWSLSGELRAHVNTNSPLPLVWQLSEDDLRLDTKRVLFALKLLDSIHKRFYGQMKLRDEFMVNQDVQEFIASLFLAVREEERAEGRQASSGNSGLAAVQPKPGLSLGSLQPTSVGSSSRQKINFQIQEKKPRLISDEYDKRDLQYEKIKHLVKSEVQGPELKRIE